MLTDQIFAVDEVEVQTLKMIFQGYKYLSGRCIITEIEFCSARSQVIRVIY